ncbi:hypothetical protein EON67_03895 [archaeon]|nr:MAG: hypothetical protein EON67_03895 [archaeon]
MHTPTPPLVDVDARASPGLSGSLHVGGRSRSSSATGMLSPPVRNGGGRPPPAAALPGGPSIMLTEPRTIAERLLAEAHLRGAKDNVTIMVIDLTRPTCGFTSAPSATDLAAHGWAEQGSSRSPASFVAPGVSPTPHHT